MPSRRPYKRLAGVAKETPVPITPRARESAMKVTKVRTDILRIPEDDPLADMPEEAGRLRPIVLVRVETDAGTEGIGLTLWGGAMTGTLRTAIEELGALTVGEYPLRIEAIIGKLRPPAADQRRPPGTR